MAPPCRLLDDNRELFVPELNEVVKPHPDFMLFATQASGIGRMQTCSSQAARCKSVPYCLGVMYGLIWLVNQYAV